MTRGIFYSIFIHVTILMGALWFSQNSFLGLFDQFKQEISKKELDTSEEDKEKDLKTSQKKSPNKIPHLKKKISKKSAKVSQKKIQSKENLKKSPPQKIPPKESTLVQKPLKERPPSDSIKQEQKIEETLSENDFDLNKPLPEETPKENQDTANAPLNEETQAYKTPPKDNDIPLIVEKPLQQPDTPPKDIKNHTALMEIPGNPQLSYPEEARKQKQEGSVMILYFVDDTGLVDQIQLLESSGFSHLDNEALRTYSRYQYFPGQTGWYKQQVNFKLKTTT